MLIWGVVIVLIFISFVGNNFAMSDQQKGKNVLKGWGLLVIIRS
ncbi:hypothetical protein [Caldicellulosiruptor acetigenus]|nr:hypothetical protein [Caldicellulosiruptor acetigenus]